MKANSIRIYIFLASIVIFAMLLSQTTSITVTIAAQQKEENGSKEFQGSLDIRLPK